MQYGPGIFLEEGFERRNHERRLIRKYGEKYAIEIIDSFDQIYVPEKRDELWFGYRDYGHHTTYGNRVVCHVVLAGKEYFRMNFSYHPDPRGGIQMGAYERLELSKNGIPRKICCFPRGEWVTATGEGLIAKCMQFVDIYCINMHGWQPLTEDENPPNSL